MSAVRPVHLTAETKACALLNAIAAVPPGTVDNRAAVAAVVVAMVLLSWRRKG